MKTLVLYASSVGNTATYAQWLAHKIQADIMPVKKADINKLLAYDTIILGSSIYAGRLSSVSILTKNMEKLSDKKIAIFTVGIADISDKKTLEKRQEEVKAQLGVNIMEKIIFFHLRGAYNYSKLSFIKKMMMKMVASQLKKKNESELSEDDIILLKGTYNAQVYDFKDPKYILPIVQWATNE